MEMRSLFSRHRIGWLFALLLAAALPGRAGAQTVVTGTVVDSSSGDPVPRATIRAAGTYAGTAAGEDGRFALRMPREATHLRIGAVGYATAVRPVPARRDSVAMTVRLASRSVPLGQVTVEADRTTDETPPSRYTIRPASVTQTPSLAEPDLIRAAAHLPGIAQPNDLDARLNVRGGSSDQNQYLLDGVEIYNPTHFFGMFGAFNPYVTGNTTVHAASFPARHGGRLSGVIDVRTRTPPDSGYTRANLGLTSVSVAHAQEWGDTGVVVGARRTYLEPALKAIGTRTRYNFLDANLKVRHQITPRVSVTGLGYFQRDDLSDGGNEEDNPFEAGMSETRTQPGTQFSTWGNVLAALRLEARYGALRQEVTGSFVRPTTEVNLPAVALNTHLRDWTVQYDGSYTWDRTRLQFGGRWKQRTFDYEWSGDERSLADVLYGGIVVRGGGATVDAPTSALETSENQSLLAGHATVEQRLFGDRVTLRGGLRAEGVREVAWQPRVRATVAATPNLRVHASAGRYAQFVATGVEGREFSVTEPLLPLDRPTTAWTYTTGVTADLGDRYRVRATAYARTMNRFPRLRERGREGGQSPSAPDGLPFRYGTASAYGLDFLLKKSKGWLTGQLAYSFGHVRTEFGNERFPPSWSIPHSLRTTLGVHLGQWDVQTSAAVHSGRPYTPPVARTVDVDSYPGELGNRILLGERNSERLPTYARIDLALRRTYQVDWGQWELYLQVLNLLNRRNLLRIPGYSLDSLYNSDRSELGERSLPILPSIGIEFTL
jgi:hypothetical protein